MKLLKRDDVLEKFKRKHPTVEITPAFLAGWRAADELIKKARYRRHREERNVKS